MTIEEWVRRIGHENIPMFSEFHLDPFRCFRKLLAKTPMKNYLHESERVQVFIHITGVREHRRKIFTGDNILMQAIQALLDGWL